MRGGGKPGPREVFGVRRHGSGVSSVLGFWGLGGGSVGGCAEVSRGGAAGQLCIWLFVIINKAIGPRAEPPHPSRLPFPSFPTRDHWLHSYLSPAERQWFTAVESSAFQD